MPLVLTGVVLVGLGVGVVAWRDRTLSLPAAPAPVDPLAPALAKALAESVPVPLEDGRLVGENGLTPPAHLVPAQNAGPYWMSAFLKYRTEFGAQNQGRMALEMALFGDPASRDLALSRLGPAMNSVVLSSEMKHAWLPDSGDVPRDGVLDATTNLARLLSLRASVRAREGRVDEAMSDLRALRRLPDLLVQAGGITALTSALRAAETTENAVQRCGAEWAESPERLAQLLTLPTGKFDSGHFLRVVDREYQMGMTRALGARGADGWPVDVEARAALAAMLHDWGQLRQVFGPRRTTATVTLISGSERDQPLRLTWYRSLAQTWEAAGVTPVVTQAYLTVLRAKVLRGAWPSSAASLDLPRDPMGQGKVGYRRIGSGGFVVWSWGPDAQDQGGRRGEEVSPASSPIPNGYMGDVVARYPLPQTSAYGVGMGPYADARRFNSNARAWRPTRTDRAAASGTRDRVDTTSTPEVSVQQFKGEVSNRPGPRTLRNPAR